MSDLPEVKRWRAERVAKDATEKIDRLNLLLAAIPAGTCPAPLVAELTVLLRAIATLTEYTDEIGVEDHETSS